MKIEIEKDTLQLVIKALTASADYIPCNTVSGEKDGDLVEYAISAVQSEIVKQASVVNNACSTGTIARLTEKERKVLALTVECWNSWCSLPTNNMSDSEEFMRAIHAAQHLIALRVARRADPDVWVQPKPGIYKDLEGNLPAKIGDKVALVVPPTSESAYHG